MRNTNRTRVRWSPVVAAAGAVAIATLTAPAAVAAPSTAAAPTGFAVVRGAHFSPNTPGVDVYLTAYAGGRSAIWLSDVGYGDVSKYRRLHAGLYVVSMRKHGAPASTPAALTWTVDAKPGAAYTVAAVGTNAHLHGIVLRDSLTAPRKGSGLVRVIQAASRAPHATLVAEPRTVVASDAAFATTTRYARVPAGTWTVRATDAQMASLSARSRVSIAASGVYSLVVLDAKHSGIEVRVIRDAAGAPVAPKGSIDAGAGGTATRRIDAGSGSALSIDLLVAAVLGISLAAAALVRRRIA